MSVEIIRETPPPPPQPVLPFVEVRVTENAETAQRTLVVRNAMPGRMSRSDKVLFQVQDDTGAVLTSLYLSRPDIRMLFDVLRENVL